MDTLWMRERLGQYLTLCEHYEDEQVRSGFLFSSKMREIDRDAQNLQPTVERILAYLDPKLVQELVPLGYESSNIDRRIRQALGILNDLEQWATKFAPSSPGMKADALHPIIWEAAAPLWTAGQYRASVHTATQALNEYVKRLSGSPQNDRALVQQVFSPESPKESQVRLHLPGDRTDSTWSSRQQGLHLLAQGAFAGIRNVAAHADATWAEQEALENLAVLSLVTRWSTKTTLVTYKQST